LRGNVLTWKRSMTTRWFALRFLRILGETQHVPQILVQTACSYLILLAITRMLGKKQLGQLTFFHYVTGITIGSVAASVSVDDQISVWEGLACMGLWGVLVMLTSIASVKSRRMRHVLDGIPTVLVENGKILDRNLAALRMNLEDLTSLLRGQGAFNMKDVEFASLEPTGNLSVLLKSQFQPLTPHDVQIPTKYHGLPHALVMDGEVQERTLERLGLTREWLLSELRKQGIESPREVMLSELDTQGDLYVDKKSVH
jgi:uncharacterized membrane protein YcaP (DUF421 family)